MPTLSETYSTQGNKQARLSMHRNTLLLTAFLAVIASLLIGFNMGRSLQQTASKDTLPTPISSPSPTFAYISGATCGVSFQYPNTLTPLESSMSGTVFANVASPDTSVIVICQKDIPRAPLAPDKIESITIRAASGSGSVSAKLYHDVSAKDGTPTDKLIFTHPKTGLDVFIGGFGAVFQQFITTLKLQ